MHILIVRNNSNSQAIDASLLLITYLATQGIDYTVVDSSKLASPLAAPELSELFDHGVDLAVALGGDGTILRTARQVGFHGTPILGINYGRLGFLANPNESGGMEPLVAALSGDAAHDPYADDGAGAEPDEPREFFALNEVAVTRGANGRIIDFGLGVSGSHLANMRGDGLVVASATGSTAYALSAGGPLVAPGFTGLVAVPIAPHTLHSRAVVTAPSDVVEMDLSENQDDRDATLFIDGELVELDRPLRRLYVRRGDVPTTLLRYKDEGFYNHAAKVFF